ncbi:hypothetical protein JCM16303_007345 [Sporobolomyces ruberrimus]
MSIVPGAGSASLPFAIPDGASWIAPYYAEVFSSLEKGASPYLSLLEVLKYLYYPKTEFGFRIQLWVLIALFSFTILIILLGLGLRLYQGRMFIVHRLDKTVVIPGGALFPLCALSYSALGLAVLVGAIQITNFVTPYPPWYQGVRAAWIGPLWTGIFFEVWACYAGWYIRRYGAHFRESTLKSIIAFSIPIFIVLVAWAPPVYFFINGAQSFNSAVRWSRVVADSLEVQQASWVSGINVAYFMSLFSVGAEMGQALLDYSDSFSKGCLYVATLLTITLLVYLVGAALELDHLSKTINRLKVEHNLGVRNRATKNGGNKENAQTALSRLSQLSHSILRTMKASKDIEEQLDDEYARGMGKGRRQWILMEWVRTNRILTTACIAALLMAEIGLLFWKGFTKVGYETPSSQFKAELLISGWLNSLLMTLVSLLILFRSLDGSSPLVDTLRTYLPFVPFPPSLERRNGTSVGSVSTNPGGPPRHHYNSEKTVIVSERPIFENKVIIEEDEGLEGGEGRSSSSEEDCGAAGPSDKIGLGYSYRPSSSASSASSSKAGGACGTSKTISRVPVPILEIHAPTNSTYSPPPPEYRRESAKGSVELDDDDSAVDKDGGN